MTYTVQDVATAIETAAPLRLAEPWDSVGLQIGDPRAAVTGVMLAVDATLAVVAEACSVGANLIVAHHPLLFSPLRSILHGDPVADVAAELIRRGSAFYAAHTNLDVAPRIGTAGALAALLALRDPRVLRGGGAGAVGPDGEITGAGRLGELGAPVTGLALAERARRQLGVPAVRLVGEAEAEVRFVAAFPGAGGDGLAEAAAAGAQVVVTGELKHHEVLEAQARGLLVILAGHRQTERPVLTTLQQYLQGTLTGLTVTIAAEDSWETTVTG